MPNYQVRIRASYEDCKEVFKNISGKCSRVVVYQHDHQSTVHCHALVWEFTSTKQTFYNWCDKALSHLPGWKSEHRTFVTTYTDKVTKETHPVNNSAIAYFSQGKYDPVFSTYPADVVAEWKSKGYAKYEIQEPTDQTKLIRKTPPCVKKRIEMLAEMQAEIGDKAIDDISVTHLVSIIRKVTKKNNYFLPKGMMGIVEWIDNLRLQAGSSALVNDVEIYYARRQRL